MKTDTQLIPSAEIDTEKWDHCINQSSNGLIYATSAYLNFMCDNWHGLVIDDYRVVMPIPWRKKMGLRYGYVPAFMQQLGVIGNIETIHLTKSMQPVHTFLSLADIHFNFLNTKVQDHFPVFPRTNLVIDLVTGYENIYSRYRNDLKENIRKAESEKLVYADGSIQEAISLYYEYYSIRMQHIKKEDYNRFQSLCELLQGNNQCFVKTVRDTNGEILAIGLFLKDGKRIYNIMNTTLPEGREKEANHFLLDKLIREFAGQSFLFDFEGSELPGVKHFYESFGAVNQPYFHYHFNGLPWLLRLFKR